VFDEAAEAQQTIQSYEAWRSLAWELTRHGERLSQALKDYVAPGRDCPREHYDWARRAQANCRAQFWQAFDVIDALITPAAPGEAPRDPSVTGSPAFNRIWTMLGVPCITVPGLTGPQGLPVGIQIVGPAGRAAAALACADWAQRALSGAA
jgi:Asp-tRNA(Asn)/Glu-tRNA(Gln) amidotransferase A subunit family amidase